MPYQPRATYDNPYGPTVAFRTEDVLPPAGVYIALDDQIIANAFCNVAGAVLNLVIRLLTPQGELKVEAYTAVSNGSLAPGTVVEVSPCEGYLLSAVVNGTGVVLGQMYVTLALGRSLLQPSQVITAILASGYVSNTSYVAYPPPTLNPAFSGTGALRYYTQTVAAGVDWSFTVPALTRWRVISIDAQLVTSATAGNRNVNLAIWDSSHNISVAVTPQTTQAPSFTSRYCWAPGLALAQPGATANIPLPTNLVVNDGQTIFTSTSALAAGDQWSQIVLYVEEWVGR